MTQPSSTPMTLGVIVGNRGFFPDHLARSGRLDIVAALTVKGIRPIILDENDSKFGAVETRQEAARCADLFKKYREQLDGIVVSLPNFGDERAIAETIRMANLGLPILVQATPDTPSRMVMREGVSGGACTRMGRPRFAMRMVSAMARSSPKFGSVTTIPSSCSRYFLKRSAQRAASWRVSTAPNLESFSSRMIGRMPLTVRAATMSKRPERAR